MAKNIGNKKKFAQIGQYIREISKITIFGYPGGPGAQKRDFLRELGLNTFFGVNMGILEYFDEIISWSNILSQNLSNQFKIPLLKTNVTCQDHVYNIPYSKVE